MLDIVLPTGLFNGMTVWRCSCHDHIPCPNSARQSLPQPRSRSANLLQRIAPVIRLIASVRPCGTYFFKEARMQYVVRLQYHVRLTSPSTGQGSRGFPDPVTLEPQ